MTLSLMKLSIMTISIMTVSTMAECCDARCLLCHVMYATEYGKLSLYAERHYSECRYAECRDAKLNEKTNRSLALAKVKKEQSVE